MFNPDLGAPMLPPCTCYCVLKRPGGLLLCMPRLAVPQDSMDSAAAAGHVGVLGPATVASIQAVLLAKTQESEKTMQAVEGRDIGFKKMIRHGQKLPSPACHLQNRRPWTRSPRSLLVATCPLQKPLHSCSGAAGQTPSGLSASIVISVANTEPAAHDFRFLVALKLNRAQRSASQSSAMTPAFQARRFSPRVQPSVAFRLACFLAGAHVCLLFGSSL